MRKYPVITIVAVVVLVAMFVLSQLDSTSRREVLDHPDRSESTRNFIKLGSGYTAYSFYGPDSGNIVVLIHGGTVPMCIWDSQIDFFTNAGFRVLCYDQYGRGESDRPNTEYNRLLFVNQLKELLDALNIKQKVNLIGPSFGGAISVTFASKYPEQVNSIVLISPALNIDNSDSKLEFPFKFSRLPIIGKPFFSTIVFRAVINRGHKQVKGGKESQCYSQFMDQFTYKGTFDAMYSMFVSDAFKNYPTKTAITGKKVKNILLVRGQDDKEITSSMITEIKSLLPNSKFIEVGGGHSPNADEASARSFNELIVDYLKEVNF